MFDYMVKPKVIAHRINSKSQLLKLDRRLGAEVDIRSDYQKLYIQHDPFTSGEAFSDWLDCYDHGTLILNVKEEGLEEFILEKLKEREITDFFFLDQSYPFLLRNSIRLDKKSAVRLSEYESIETVELMRNSASWVWVDYFSTAILDTKLSERLKCLGLNICLVSPELQGFNENKVEQYQRYLVANRIAFDAVCTKHYNKW
ncbi:hypothetical protein N9O45_03420 [Planktomarina temperata]|nr:hypothetical protein [Planktomarina temperata]